MKKLLALVLALVMTLSLCVTSNAAYSDAADVDYNEAVDVMSAVGVFQGADGKFSPKAELTREQAAKLIAYLDLGESVAEALPAVKVFSDVEANRWSAKYIAYCADAGYIAGVGDGSFNPTGKLTGYAFGKMLLCALGYSAEIENLTGASWMINVAKLMESNDIADDVDAAPSATLTREQAAQYCLNTLKATCVKYDNAQTVTIGNVEIKQSSKAESYAGTYMAVYGEATSVQLLEKLYKDDLVYSATSVKDDFGRPGHKWTYDAKTVGTYADTPVVTYTAKMDSASGIKQIAADLKGYKFKDTHNDLIELKTKDTTAGSCDITSTQIPGLPAQIDIGDTLADEVASWTANGKVVEVYADSTTKVVTAVNTITYTVAKITNVTTNKDGDVTYAISGLGGSKVDYADDYANEDTIALHGTFAKNDFVTYVQGVVDTTVYHVFPTTKVVGQQTANDGTTLTIGGTQYKLGKGVTNYNGNSSSYVNTKKDANYFLDQFGYVVASSDVEADLVYAVVNKIAGENKSTGINTGKSIQAELVLADGTKETVDVAKINNVEADSVTYKDDDTDGSQADDAVTVSNKNGNNGALTGKVVTYTVNSDGEYELKYASTKTATTAAGGTLTNKGVPAFAKGQANAASGTSTTVYVVATTNSESKTVFKSYTGYASVPTIEAKSGQTVSAIYATEDSKVVFVYIDATANNVGEKTAENNIFWTHSATVTVNGTGSDAYWTVTGYVDGVKTTIQTKLTDGKVVDPNGTPAKMSADTFYELNINEDGYVTSAVAATWDATGTADDAFIEEVADGSFGGYLWNEKTVVFSIDKDGVMSESSAEAIAVGNSYKLILNSTGTEAEKNTIDTLYIIEA